MIHEVDGDDEGDEEEEEDRVPFYVPNIVRHPYKKGP